MRILRVLADGEKHGVKALCETEEIPQQFAYKIVRKLGKAQWVKSVRGVSGGCVLTADLQGKTLCDLMEVMEDERQVIACLRPGYVCQWVGKQRQQCLVHHRLAEVQQALDAELRAYTLQEVLFGKK